LTVQNNYNCFRVSNKWDYCFSYFDRFVFQKTSFNCDVIHWLHYVLCSGLVDYVIVVALNGIYWLWETCSDSATRPSSTHHCRDNRLCEVAWVQDIQRGSLPV